MNLSVKYGVVQILFLQILFASGLEEGCRERFNLMSYDAPLIDIQANYTCKIGLLILKKALARNIFVRIMDQLS